MIRIIEIQPNELGGHENLTIYDAEFYTVPNGWCIIPNEIEIPETFPFVHFHYRNGVVLDMSPGTVPPSPEPPEPEPEEDVWAEIADAIRNGVNMVD